jgi:cyclin-dependent kinase 1
VLTSFAGLRSCWPCFGLNCTSLPQKIKSYREDDEGIPSTELREISLLQELKHPNVVILKDIILDTRLYLVFEYVDMDLKKYMNSVDGMLKPEEVQSFMYQLCSGVAYCHSHGVMHRDLKPQNLLVSKEGALKIADFGLGRAFSPPIRALTHEVYTLWYRAPEILLGSQTYAPPVDAWACGCILAELSRKRPLFPGDSEIDEIFKIFQLLGTPNEQSWPGCLQLPDWNSAFPFWDRLTLNHKVPDLNDEGVQLLESFLLYDPAKRLSAKASLNHQFFAGCTPST